MSSYIISVAEGPGSYRHIRISSEATLLDLHEAITDAYKLEKGGSPYFRPQTQAKGGQPIKYRINNSKTAVAMRGVKLKDAGFATKKTMIYFPAETRITLNCRTLQVMDEETPEPQVVRASGSSFDYKLGFQRVLKALQAHTPMLSIREAEGKALALPEKTQRKLAAYVLAASNLHGLVPIETIHQFYISGHLPPDLLAFKMFCVIFSDRADTRFYILDKQGKVLSNGQQERSRAHYIAEYTVVEGKAFSYVRAQQEGKPYYLPPEEDFLRWADEDYVEESEHYLRLRSHLLTLGLNMEKAKACMADILTCIRFDSTHPQKFIDILEEYKIILKDLKAVNVALNLFTRLGNNTRTHLNGGHTPEEIGGLLGEKPGGTKVRPYIPLFGLDPLRVESTSQEEDAELQAGDMKLVQFPRRVEKKPGRNDPCPCGSGKKYKHCCGKSGADRGS